MYWAHKSFGAQVKTGLEKALENPRTTFHILRHEGRIVGYGRTDDNSDAAVPHAYFGSFNVDNSYEGAKIGEFLYRELIKHGVKTSGRIEADCEPSSDISKFYMREFVATGIDMSYGEPLLHIVLDREKYQNLMGRSMDERKIIAYAHSDSYKSGDLIIREIVPNDSFAEFEEGKVMSRYFNDKNTGKTYAVFEPDRSVISEAA